MLLLSCTGRLRCHLRPRDAQSRWGSGSHIFICRGSDGGGLQYIASTAKRHSFWLLMLVWSGKRNKRLNFYLRVFSASLSLAVGVLWIVLSSIGILDKIFD